MASGESMTLLRDHAIEGLTAIFWPQELELTLSIDWRIIVLPHAAHGLTSPCSKNKLTLVRTFGHVLMFLPFCLPVYYCLLLPALREAQKNPPLSIQQQERGFSLVILRKDFVAPRVSVFPEKTVTTNKLVLAILPTIHVLHKFHLRGLLPLLPAISKFAVML